MVAGQTLIHGALTALAGHRGDPPLHRSPALHLSAGLPAGHGRRVGSLHDQVHAGHPGAIRAQLSVPAPVQHVLADLTGPHALMALAHLLAALLVGLWLARGERALWALLAVVGEGVADVLVRTLLARHGRSLALARTAGATASLRPVAAGRWQPPSPPNVSTSTRGLGRRGPPALLPA